jgi:Cu/Ag efflux protein CusF
MKELMTTTILRTLWVTAILATCSVCTKAAEQLAGDAGQKSWTGTVTEVDARERTVRAKKFLSSRTFNIPENCAFSINDKKDAALGDLRPGHKVCFAYQDVNGVLVANRIAQEDLLYQGTVKYIDPKNRTVTVKRAGSSKAFCIADDCKVLVKDDKNGTLGDIKTGHKVSVTYETPNEALVARRIEQKSSTFVGDLSAIDVPARTVKARQLFTNKKFNLANECVIVLNGKENAQLSDLRIGQKVTFSYEDVGGVNVVNRIAQTGEPAEPRTPETAKSSE